VLIERVEWRALRVPFKSPFATSGGTVVVRDTVVLAVHAEGGRAGWGEATPWPAFGCGTAVSAAVQIAQLAPRLRGKELAVALQMIDEPSWDPAVRYAFELALFDLIDGEREMPLAARFGSGRGPVSINALLGSGTAETVAAAARSAVATGFETLKLKVGAGSRADLAACVRSARAAVGPAVHLRLDANGTWSEEEAALILRALAPYDLEYVEQPVAAADIGALARLRASSPVRIAADEAVSDAASAYAVLAAAAADVLIVKPMVTGGLRAAFEIARQAANAGVVTVVTTTIDFGIATAGALHLAAALDPALACGLGTAGLLVDDLTNGVPTLVRGQMALPKAPGLGVGPSRAALARYAATPA